MSLMQLPSDCIEIILDHLDETTRINDLVSLLTVNKAFFQKSAKRLYSDPRAVLRECRNRTPHNDAEQQDTDQEDSVQSASGYEEMDKGDLATRGFLALVLRYSPAQDADVQLLRSDLSKELDALPEKPTVDYLSLITTVRFDEQAFGHMSHLAVPFHVDESENPENNSTKWYTAFAWAACGHRLSEVHDMEIFWDDLDRYHSRVDDMASMRTIRLRTIDIPTGDLSEWARDKKDHILQGLQGISRFLGKWTVTHANLRDSSQVVLVEFQLECNRQSNGWWWQEPFSQELEGIFKQLPASTPRTMRSSRTLDWARLFLSPETLDLARIESIEAETSYDPDAMMYTKWPEQGIATILKQCRSLRRLYLYGSSDVQEDIFDWAYRERQAAMSSDKNELQEHDLAPLAELSISCCGRIVWEKAIFAFKSTLTEVDIHSSNPQQPVDLGLFRDMPKLQQLHVSPCFINGNSEDSVLFTGCPKLEVITLSGNSSGSSSESGAASEQRYRWDLPLMKSLTLVGPIACRFDQATFQTMPKLEHLSVKMNHLDGQNNNSTTSFAWDMDHWGPFPYLEMICLESVVAETFEWQMLDRCPKLEELQLMARHSYHGPHAMLGIENSTLPLTVHPSLTTLCLYELYIPLETLFDLLPRAVPNLHTLELCGCSGFKGAEEAEFYKKFPNLRVLETDDFSQAGKHESFLTWFK